MTAPTIGMNAPRKTSTATGIASGHAEQEGAEADADRVDGRDEQLGAGVVDDRHPSVARPRRRPRDAPLREQPGRPAPDAGAVGEQAQQDEEGEHGAGGDVADGRADRECARQQELGLLLDEAPALRQEVVDLGRA